MGGRLCRSESGTGGFAITQIKAAWNFAISGTPFHDVESASASTTKAGWVIGGGIETMLPGRLVIGAEYLYVNFANVSATGFDVNTLGVAIDQPFNHSADLTANIVRPRLSKLF